MVPCCEFIYSCELTSRQQCHVNCYLHLHTAPTGIHVSIVSSYVKCQYVFDLARKQPEICYIINWGQKASSQDIYSLIPKLNILNKNLSWSN